MEFSIFVSSWTYNILPCMSWRSFQVQEKQLSKTKYWMVLGFGFGCRATRQISPGSPDFWTTCLRLRDTHYYPLSRLKVIPHKRVPGHMEAWILVADLYLTRARCCTTWSSQGLPFGPLSSIECEPMPSWPVVECARLKMVNALS